MSYYQNKRRGRRNQKAGKLTENLVRGELERHGLLMVEKIATPVNLTQYYDRNGHKVPGVFYVTWGIKVSGDIRAFTPAGIGVLVESKSTTGTDRLVWSRLEKHQARALDNCHGISLLAWVNEWGVFIMRWPIPGFGPGKSITLERARQNEWQEYF